MLHYYLLLDCEPSPPRRSSTQTDSLVAPTLSICYNQRGPPSIYHNTITHHCVYGDKRDGWFPRIAAASLPPVTLCAALLHTVAGGDAASSQLQRRGSLARRRHLRAPLHPRPKKHIAGSHYSQSKHNCIAVYRCGRQMFPAVLVYAELGSERLPLWE